MEKYKQNIKIGSKWQSIDGKVVTIDFVKNHLVVWTHKNEHERLRETTFATRDEYFLKDFKEIIS